MFSRRVSADSVIMKGGHSTANKKQTRPLGSVRKIQSTIDTVPKFPPLTPVASYQGVSGSAMQVPPARELSSEPEDRTAPKPVTHSPRKSCSSSKSADSSSVTSDKHDATARDLKEAMTRERHLKQQIMQLQKVIDNLRMQVKDKEKIIDDLQKQFMRQEEKYKELYEREQERHLATRESLEQTRQDLDLARTTISDMQYRHETETRELRQLMEIKLTDLRVEKDKEIALREEKLNKLKKQMADALKGNSWERQQQLDELSKELTRVQDEADMLKHRIKALQKSKQGQTGCDSCESLQSQVAASKKTITDRDGSIQELKSLCSKFEKQLSQQDVLLRQFAEQAGHKVKTLPK